MKNFISILVLFVSSFISAQPKLEMTSNGFASIEFDVPNRPTKDLVEISKGWANSNLEKRSDVYDITESSLSVDAFKKNAYHYLNRGETYQFDIRYTMKIAFQPNNTCKVTFAVKEIYDSGNALKTTIADFFAPDGRLKEDFEEVKPSLEETVNKIVRSFASNFLVN